MVRIQYLSLFALLMFANALDNRVKTDSGEVIGTVVKYFEDDVMAFLGIPFAEPPVEKLRFKKPVPIKKWSSPVIAKSYPPACIQPHDYPDPWADLYPNQKEDCLYLNIWVPPHTKKTSKKSVMFWIFSGGFAAGSNRLPVYDGRVLVSEGDVILVTVNYRLGILGFLSTTSKEAPGNMGLYDQLEALKWVNRNIHAFGGDNNSITVFGQSAGSEATGLFCLSPLTKGLFQRAIMMSAAPALPVINAAPENKVLAQRVAKAVNCLTLPIDFTINPSKVIKCLRKKDAALLVRLADDLKDAPYLVTFSVIVGDDIVPVEPKVQLLAGNIHDVDFLIGHTQDEGSFVLTSSFPKDFGHFGELNPKVNKSSGENYIRKFFGSFDLPIGDAIAKYYLKGLDEDDYITVRRQTYHSFGDLLIVCPDTYFAESVSKNGKTVYAYYFNHIPSVTPWAHWMGAVHFDDVAFVFGRPLDHPKNYTCGERCLSRRMIRMWTDFAKTGKPSKKWPKFTRANEYFQVLKAAPRINYLDSHKKNCDFFRTFYGSL